MPKGVPRSDEAFYKKELRHEYHKARSLADKLAIITAHTKLRVVELKSDEGEFGSGLELDSVPNELPPVQRQ